MAQALLVVVAFHAVLWSGVAVLVALEPPRWQPPVPLDRLAPVTDLPRRQEDPPGEDELPWSA